MYVAPEARGRRLGAVILRELERLAREFGYRRAILETGNRNPEAIHLYERSGYEHISPYPPYLDSARSVCFARQLEP
jgi:putative acetyltransferase